MNHTPHHLRPYRCTWQNCSKGFAGKQGLDAHIRTHTGEKTHHCTECDKRFAESHQLRTHMVVHTGETPYLCKYCGQKFKFLSTRNNHKCEERNKDSIGIASEKCDILKDNQSYIQKIQQKHISKKKGL